MVLKAGQASGGGQERPSHRIEANILIIEARYYEDVGEHLLSGARTALAAQGAEGDIIGVPGALEIPQVLAQSVKAGLVGSRAEQPRYAGVVALGCVIRGETSHYDVVVNNANHWLMEAAIHNAIPLGNAILTVDTHEQALERAAGGIDGKGADAVRACLRLIELSRGDLCMDVASGITR